MLKDLFKKRKYITVSSVDLDEIKNEHKPIIPDGMWQKCDNCGKIIYKDDLEDNLKVCTNCNHHLRLNAYERINITVDKDSFVELNKDIISKNPLDFSGYEKKLKNLENSTGLKEAVVTGTAKMQGMDIVLCIMDSSFMMGSMGAAVGEKITLAVEYATEKKLPVIIFTASGGARMQEGIFSLMQMAKVSAALAKHGEAGLPYITVITDPTTGGVTASFAMQGDIILSEPKALIGFAGKRVIKNTVKTELPEGFQSAEFMLEKGFIDEIVNRKDLRGMLIKLLMLHKEMK
ncbi:acetyl-CoA carboxylase carboxyltransferase subunit beta [Clostridium sp. 19966]|uniref:acetyl-CoA carboxylase, carboxyltransferase subunit beta n=1 Tax=Clostridium sp. 19966 TaxID=2768166 RepID=UPI0028DDB07B|nr:acetyl-CoA carboxylase, carboxyltransferase subunit beta [Clostridium sp. 19966]MDT8716265.1 acetyl-CoA carboxylase carboxyltransferase subunit beta [Clostridium sp. 19966]